MNTLKEIGFFLLSFLMYVGFGYYMRKLDKDDNISNFIIIFTAIAVTLSLFGYIQILKPFKEGYKYNQNGPVGSYSTVTGPTGSSGPTGPPRPDGSNTCCSSCPNNTLDISHGKLCRGGPYTWQGDGVRAKMCRELASTEEGKKIIDRFECGDGYSGIPGCGFEFTPISDNCWKNARCDGKSVCDVKNNSILL